MVTPFWGGGAAFLIVIRTLFLPVQQYFQDQGRRGQYSLLLFIKTLYFCLFLLYFSGRIFYFSFRSFFLFFFFWLFFFKLIIHLKKKTKKKKTYFEITMYYFPQHIFRNDYFENNNNNVVSTQYNKFSKLWLKFSWRCNSRRAFHIQCTCRTTLDKKVYLVFL